MESNTATTAEVAELAGVESRAQVGPQLEPALAASVASVILGYARHVCQADADAWRVFLGVVYDQGAHLRLQNDG